MKEWLTISILLCIFGFIKEIRPSETFIFEYLIGPSWNLTKEDVVQGVFPISTYAYLAQLIIVFLITDACRYKAIIITLGLAGITVWGMLIWGRTLWTARIVQISYGTFMAAEVAYYTYIYAKVPKEYYSQVTSHTRAAILAGHCLAAVLAQALLELNAIDYKGLHYISFTAMIAATLWSFLLPSVPESIYFHRNLEKDELSTLEKYNNAFSLMKSHLLDYFSNKYVLKWSLWWALAACGFIQVQNYVQPLWSVIHAGHHTLSLHNGTVEALFTLAGCVGALSAGVQKTDWKLRGELVLSLYSILAGAVIIISSQTSNIIVSYGCYVAFGGLYHTVITIAASEVAKHILEDSYALVFGLNTLIALVLQTLLTLCLVTGDLGWALSPRGQHLAYGVYHMGMAILFIVIGLVNWSKNQADINKTY